MARARAARTLRPCKAEIEVDPPPRGVALPCLRIALKKCSTLSCTHAPFQSPDSAKSPSDHQHSPGDSCPALIAKQMKLTALQFGFSVSILAHGLTFSVAPLLRSGHQNPSAALGGETILELMTIDGGPDSQEQSTPADSPQALPSITHPDKAPAAASQENPVPKDALELPTPQAEPVAMRPQTFTPVDAVEVDRFLDASFSVLAVSPVKVARPVVGKSQFPAKTSASSSQMRNAVSVAYRSALPSYLYNPKPAYPKDARARRQQGQVIVVATVTADGFPEEIAVNQTSGFDSLDRAALQAVKTWRFVPARDDGQPVDSRVEIPFNFLLPN